MRFMSTIKQKAADGFTLIEVLIIAPVVILVISGFIALIVVLVGDVLAVRDRNNMSYEIRDSLDRIEQDVRISTQFLVTSSTLQAPQGSDSNFTGTAAFSNSNSLILGTLTTDKNPVDSTRQLVYYAKQPNDCSSSLLAYNRAFISKVIYFIKDGSLWRRSYLLPYNTTASPANDETLCSAPWQQNSCSPGYTSPRCQTSDQEMMKNVSSFSVKYYSSPQSNTDIGASNALNASSVEVRVNGSKTIAGRTVTNTSGVRVNKLNNIDADLPIPAAPTVPGGGSATPGTISGVASGPTNTVSFAWDPVPSATSYLISYNINGGAWIDATNDGFTTNFVVTAYRNDTVTLKVAAKNSSGTSPYSQAAATMPAWNECVLQNNWQNYANGYADASYTKTTAEVVTLKGLVRNGTATANTPICTLPAGFRPDKRLIFATSSNSAAGRIEITNDGVVRFGSGSNAWISLDGIRFIASTGSYTWTSPALQNGWTDYGGDTYNHEATLDSQGRVHVRGVVVPGTTTAGTALFSFPANQSRWNQFTYLPTSGASGFNWNGFGGAIDARGNPGGWLSLQAMYYPSSYAGWSDMTSYLQAGWSFIGNANHATPAFVKSADGIVTLKGMVKRSTNDDGSIIAKLPAGYRPKEQLLTSCVSFGAFCRIDVKANGDVVDTLSPNSNGWVSLDNISFMAEQ